MYEEAFGIFFNVKRPSSMLTKAAGLVAAFGLAIAECISYLRESALGGKGREERTTGNLNKGNRTCA